MDANKVPIHIGPTLGIYRSIQYFIYAIYVCAIATMEWLQ